MSRSVPCRRCGVDLHHHGEVTAVDLVCAADDPVGKDRVDLILECDCCGTKFNAFVPDEDFQVIA